MDELKITRKTEPVMFTIRVDKSIVDFYDDLARKTNRSRNELIGLALEYAKDKIKVESWFCDIKIRRVCRQLHTRHIFISNGLHKQKNHPEGWLRCGAADEARTRYLHLGKVALYQMSYGRLKWCLRSESNQWHGDFQSPALPTELQRQATDIIIHDEDGFVKEKPGKL